MNALILKVLITNEKHLVYQSINAQKRICALVVLVNI